ncbi:nitrogen regulation protein NR(II) [Candidatus Zixiibacteriota bacterium]
MVKLKVFGWFLPLRLAQYIILFGVVVFWMNYPQFIRSQFVLYSILTLCFSVFLAAEKKYKLKNVTSILIGLQFLFELIIESSIIYSTGNINSPFSVLFILTIISAALVYRLIGSLILASLTSVAYAFIIWLGLGWRDDPELSMKALKTIFSTQDSVFYSIFLHILIFYLVAFISGYLSERLKERDKLLEVASQALKKAKLETDDILKHLNSGLLTIDANGYIIYFNRAAEKILGYREEDVKGMHCKDVFAERMPDLSSSLLAGIRANIEHPRKEIAILNHDGGQVPLGLSTSILREIDHGMRGIIAIFSDLTEAKLLESKVRIADRLSAIGELSASIAHEIRNPLAAISGSVEVLKSDLDVSGENKRLMNLIIKESDRLTNLLNEFLTYAKIDRPKYQKVELLHIVSDVIEILHHHRSFSDNININIDSDESIIYVVGDEGLIKQLLLNIAVNACEAFIAQKGSLIFRLVYKKDVGKIELYIQDDGPGIDPDLLKDIYNPFFSTKKEGTGLGLSIVQKICSALKLYISVDSQIDEGTTFMIEFNVYQNQPTQKILSVNH